MLSLSVIKRNKETVPYDESKIQNAMLNAFVAVEGNAAKNSDRVWEIVQRLTAIVTNILQGWDLPGPAVKIEHIQDQVELALMRSGEYPVAQAYIRYRHERQQAREKNQAQSIEASPAITVTLPDGTQEPLNLRVLQQLIESACAGLDGVDANYLLDETVRNLYSGVPQKEVSKALQLSPRTLIEKEPDYTFVAARLLSHELRDEALAFLELAANQSTTTHYHPDYFNQYISKGIELELLDPKLETFDLEKLANAMDLSRDAQFTYLRITNPL